MRMIAAPPDPIDALREAIPRGADAAFRAGSLAMRADCEEAAIPLLRNAVARYRGEARLWQILGLCARTAGDLAAAVDALARARDLAPADALIAHGIARARLEAGLPAIDDFVRARRLSPTDGSIVQGLAAARFAAGDVASAIAELEAGVRGSPQWLDGHATLARLRRMAGDPDPLRSYREATTRVPGAADVWRGWLATLSAAERYGDMAAVAHAARATIGDVAGLALFQAIADDETGGSVAAGTHFDGLPADLDAATRVWRVRSLLRRGRIEQAAGDALAGTGQAGGWALWPYVAMAWRLLSDPRWHWLEGDPAFVQIHDLSDGAGDRRALADRLRSLHVARDRPLDQSVRGGTQTDGPLLSRIEPEIVRLRTAIVAAVERYVGSLPAPDAHHPLLGAPRTPLRFAGSWSVRLTGGGHHADHVHSHGWISSALYVALPDGIGGGERAGWLTLGGSAALLPDLAPFREIEPAPGRLVLFPSTMWHGTRPFASGERLTVAFDVARMGQ